MRDKARYVLVLSGLAALAIVPAIFSVTLAEYRPLPSDRQVVATVQYYGDGHIVEKPGTPETFRKSGFAIAFWCFVSGSVLGIASGVALVTSGRRQ